MCIVNKTLHTVKFGRPARELLDLLQQAGAAPRQQFGTVRFFRRH